MALYGALGLSADGLRVLGALALPPSAGTALRRRVHLWDPWWVVDGVLFILFAHRRRTAALTEGPGAADCASRGRNGGRVQTGQGGAWPVRAQGTARRGWRSSSTWRRSTTAPAAIPSCATPAPQMGVGRPGDRIVAVSVHHASTDHAIGAVAHRVPDEPA